MSRHTAAICRMIRIARRRLSRDELGEVYDVDVHDQHGRQAEITAWHKDDHRAEACARRGVRRV